MIVIEVPYIGVCPLSYKISLMSSGNEIHRARPDLNVRK